MAVAANKEEFRPASAANVRVDVKDHQGRGTPSEVTLWAVDYGVLSLTSYRTPDILGSVYVRKALQVMNADSRQRIISRRVLTPKGETEGGGGGADAGAGTHAEGFPRAGLLARIRHDRCGRPRDRGREAAGIADDLPDHGSRRGPELEIRRADAEVRTNKPLTLKPTFPRFLAVGDRAYFRRGGRQPASSPAAPRQSR